MSSGVRSRLATRRRIPAVPAGLTLAMLVGVQLFPNGMPGGLYGVSAVYGAQAALGAIGVLLVYRTDRIINFAQIQLGALGGVLFFELVNRRQLVRWAHALCPPCAPEDPARAGDAWLYVNFSLALALALGVAALVGLAVRVLVVRRFRGQPPLVGTVATLGVVQILAFLTAQVPTWFLTRAERRATKGIAGATGVARPPDDVTVRWDPAVFHVGEIATVLTLVAVVGALALFARRSRIGIGVRAAADNAERAATLGMDGERLAARVWLLAGLLSGVAAVLGAMTSGVTGVGGVSASGLLRILAAVVIARMDSVGVAVALSIAFAVFDQGFLWSFGDGTLVDAVVFVALVATLLARRAGSSGRVDAEAAGWRATEEARPIPAQLRDLPVVRRARRMGPVALAIVLLAFPWLMSPNDTQQGTLMIFYAMIGLSLLVLTGWAGQISLGHFAFAAVGGYVAAIVGGAWGWPLPLALLGGALAGSVVALVVGLPALRIRGLYLAVTTLGFAVVASTILLGERFGGRFLPETLPRPVFLGLNTADERVWYYLALVVLAGYVAAVVGMRRSRTARALIASRDNERAAGSLGIDLVRARLEAFAVSGFMAALAGALFAYHQQGVHAGNYAPQASFDMFLLAVIGGLGSVVGPLLGALYVGALVIFARGIVDLGSGIAALLILLFVPAGLTRIAYSVRDLVLRRVAERHRVVVPGLTGAAAATEYRTPIAPKLGPDGSVLPVPARYRLSFHRPTLERPATRRHEHA